MDLFEYQAREIFEAQGWVMRGGSIVDATIIAAPSSTKNASGRRDPAMHQTKKGNQWYFGMKAHVGVDAGTGYVHSVRCTAANVHDLDPLVDLIRADTHTCYKGERGALHDWGYGCGECPACALRARGYQNYVAGKAA